MLVRGLLHTSLDKYLLSMFLQDLRVSRISDHLVLGDKIAIRHTSKLLYPSFHLSVCPMAIPATPAPTTIVFGSDIVLKNKHYCSILRLYHQAWKPRPVFKAHGLELNRNDNVRGPLSQREAFKNF